MANCGSLMKTVLFATVLVALVESGFGAEKLASCCTKVTKTEITDPIQGYLIQKNNTRPCVNAVIFQTDKGLFCTYPRAPWVIRKVIAYMNAKRQATSPSVSPTQVSLLSIITSTASPPSSSTPLPPLPSTAKTPIGENLSKDSE